MRLSLKEQGFKLRGGRKSEFAIASVFIVAMMANWWPDLLPAGARSFVDALAYLLLGIFVSGYLPLWEPEK